MKILNVVIGGAGFMGNFVVSELLKHPVQKLLYMIILLQE